MSERPSFAQVTAVDPRERGLFDAWINPEWTIGGKPNGGYLLAMLGTAAALASQHEHVIAASAHYLASPEPGPACIQADVQRASRSASHVHARMSQWERACVEALITTSELDADAKPYWTSSTPAVSNVAYEDCPRLIPRLPAGERVAILDQVEVRLEPATSGFISGRPSGRGELRGWLSLPGGEPFNPASLLYACDAYPAATFDIEYAGWIPTMALTVYVHALPAPGPVRILQRAQVIDGQRVGESCFIWDRTGRLVAQGSQLAVIRLGH